MIMKIKHILEFCIIFLLSIIFKILPLKISYAIMWMIAFFFHRILNFRRKEAINRLTYLYKETLSFKEIEAIAWNSWRNLCFNILEIMRYNKLSQKSIAKMGLSSSLNALKDRRQNKSVIYATIHMGNWELAGVSLNLIGAPIFSIARPQKNKFIDAYLNSSRGKFGLEVLSNEDGSLQKIIRRLKNNESFLILPDVRSSKADKNILFLNEKAKLGLGAAAFAKSCNIEIIPFIIKRNGFFKHEISIMDSIFPSADIPKKEDISRMMNELMEAFSKEINAFPDQYFWYNKRWVLDP